MLLLFRLTQIAAAAWADHAHEEAHSSVVRLWLHRVIQRTVAEDEPTFEVPSFGRVRPHIWNRRAAAAAAAALSKGRDPAASLGSAPVEANAPSAQMVCRSPLD